MEAGLIDILLGRFSDGQAVADEHPAQWKLRSIIDNLSRLFNTRRGSLPISGLRIAGYLTGIPRSSLFHRRTAGGAIKQVVEKYEPRLRRIRVEQESKGREADFEMRVTFIVSGELRQGQKVQFQTTFKSNELARGAALAQAINSEHELFFVESGHP